MRRSKVERAARRWRTSRPGWMRRSTGATRSGAGWRVRTGRGWPRPPRWPPTIRSPRVPGRPSTGSRSRTAATTRTASTPRRIAGLVRALDYPGAVEPDELERLAHAVQSRGDGLPESLRLRYITRLREAESARARRKRLVVAGSTAAAILAVALVSLAVRSHTRSRRLGGGRPVDQRPARARPARAGRRPVEEVPGRRRRPLPVSGDDRGPAAARAGAGPGVGPGPAIRPGDARGPVGPGRAKPPPALERARSLARLETEKSQIDELVRRRASAMQAEEGRREQELAPRLDGIAESVDRARGAAQDRGPGADGRRRRMLGSVAESQRSLSELASEVSTAGAGMQERSRNLSDRLETVRARMERRGLRARLEDAITAAIAYSPDGRGFGRLGRPGPGAPGVRQGVPRLARGHRPSRPRWATSRSGTRSPSGTGSPTDGGADRPRSRRRRPASGQRSAGSSWSSIRRRPTSIASRRTSRRWRPCRIAPPRARGRSANSRS